MEEINPNSKTILSKNNRIPFLDGIRAIACLIVVFAHLLASHSTYGLYASGCGKIGVWFFMVVSGFLIGVKYLGKVHVDSPSFFIKYYIKKFITLYPLYFLCLVVCGLFGFIDLDTFQKALVFHASWGHLWYIPVVVQFYLIVPFLILIYDLLQMISKNTTRGDIIYISLLMIISIIFGFLFPYPHYVENSIYFFWYVPIFLFGIVISQIDKYRRFQIPFSELSLLVAFVIMFICSPLGMKLLFNKEPSGWLQNKYIYLGILWGISILGVNATSEKVPHYIKSIFLESKILKFISSISFEVYLIHYIVLMGLNEYSNMPYILKVLIVLLTSTLVGACLCFINRRLIIITKKNIKVTSIILISFVCSSYVIVGISNKNQKENKLKNEWKNNLYVPTMISKYDNTYFINDCWNHRIIYNWELDKDISKWSSLTDEGYIGGHTISTDGEVFLVDNTDASEILVYKKKNREFIKSQTIYGITGRPHCCIYDKESKQFLVIGSESQKLYIFENKNGVVFWTNTIELPNLEKSYVRSISLIDGKLYTVSGPNSINEYLLTKDNEVNFLKSYPVPGKYSGMNNITKIGSYFYCTINTDDKGSVEAATMFRVKKLSDIEIDDVEDIKELLSFKTQPYFITNFDNKYYCTEISSSGENGIMSFEVDSLDNFTNIQWLCRYESPSESSICRFNSKYIAKSQQVDLILFAGQSNMAGHGNFEDAPQVKQGYEYKAISDPTNIYPISEPFGKYENKEDGINDTFDNMTVFRKSGGMVSSFANSYLNKTGVPIVGVSCSEGTTRISEWLPGTNRFKDLVNRLRKARKYINYSNEFSLRHTYLVWCQGESDGDGGVSSEEYYYLLDKLVNSLIDERIEKIFLVRIGNNAKNENKYDSIIDAQTRYCKNNTSCVLVSTRFAEMNKLGLMRDEYHYYQEGYNIVGTEAGDNAGYYVDTGFEPNLFDYKYNKEYCIN